MRLLSSHTLLAFFLLITTIGEASARVVPCHESTTQNHAMPPMSSDHMMNHQQHLMSDSGPVSSHLDKPCCGQVTCPMAGCAISALPVSSAYFNAPWRPSSVTVFAVVMLPVAFPDSLYRPPIIS